MDGFFKKVSTNVARAKQVAMVKIGQAEATSDPQFNQEESNFKAQYARMKKLIKGVQTFEEALKECGTSEAATAQALLEQYEPSSPMYLIAQSYSDKAVTQLETLRARFVNLLAEKFHQPMSQYLIQYKTIEDRIVERNRRLIDMDRYNLEYKQASEKLSSLEPLRLQLAKEKADKHAVEYKEINDELLVDIPRLLHDRTEFIDALFANLVDLKIEFYGEVAKIYKSFEVPLQAINRSKIANPHFVITDPSQSTMNPKLNHPSQAQQQNAQPKSAKPTPTPVNPQPHAQQPPMGRPQQPPPQVNTNALRAQALYVFQGVDQSELSFQPGEIITVIRQSGEWWEGEIGARRGLFPANYVRLI